MKQGNLDQGFKQFHRIIEIDPTNADAYYFLGTIYNFRHNTAKAIEYLKKARDADSDEHDTHYRLAQAFHNLDMTSNAHLEYQRTLALKPSHTKAMNGIGWIYYNSGDRDAAISEWKKTLKVNPKDRDAIFNLAKAYNDLAWEAKEMGRPEEAIAYWKKTLGVDPKNKAALSYLKKHEAH
jgi:tetratricopeptide (TPR) repeat protein